MVRRDTKQRQLILNAVRARCDHPTADQIYDDIHTIDARISRGTVYRNLNLLSEEGEICHVRVPGADRYDLRVDLHCHMFCIECKKVIDAPYPYSADLDSEIAKKSGYKIMRHRLIFEGICPVCQSNGIRTPSEVDARTSCGSPDPTQSYRVIIEKKKRRKRQ